MQISRRKSLSSLLVTLGVFGKTLIANEPRPNFVHSSGVDEFTRKLREAESLVNFFYLMNTKETQVNDGFCGPTSVCMAINSLPAIDRRKFVRLFRHLGPAKIAISQSINLRAQEIQIAEPMDMVHQLSFSDKAC